MIRRTGLLLALGGLMVVVDTTVTVVAVPAMVAGLHSTLATVQWVTTAYLLGIVAVIPLAARLVERFGARRVYVLALLAFTLCSTLAGLAWSAAALAVFRALQGLGGGLINPVGQAIGLRAARRSERGRLMSMLGLPLIIGPVLGPPLAGWLIDAASWRWIFLVNVPIGLLAATLAARLLPPDTLSDSSPAAAAEPARSGVPVGTARPGRGWGGEPAAPSGAVPVGPAGATAIDGVDLGQQSATEPVRPTEPAQPARSGRPGRDWGARSGGAAESSGTEDGAAANAVARSGGPVGGEGALPAEAGEWSGVASGGPRVGAAIDWVGLGQLSGGGVLVVLGCTLVGRGGTPWWVATGTLGVGVLLLAAFVVRARRVAAPLVDLGLFGVRPFRVGAGVLAAFGAGYFGGMSILPVFVQGVRGDPAALAGTLAVPAAVAVGITVQVATRLVDRLPARRIVVSGGMLGVVGVAVLLVATTRDLGYPVIVSGAVLLGAGSGAVILPTMTVALRDLPGDVTPRGTTLLALVQQLSGAVGTAVVAAGLTLLLSGPTDGGGVAAMLQLDPAARSESEPALASATGYAYGMVLILVALSVVAAMRLRPARNARRRSGRNQPRRKIGPHPRTDAAH